MGDVFLIAVQFGYVASGIAFGSIAAHGERLLLEVEEDGILHFVAFATESEDVVLHLLTVIGDKYTFRLSDDLPIAYQ